MKTAELVNDIEIKDSRQSCHTATENTFTAASLSPHISNIYKPHSVALGFLGCFFFPSKQLIPLQQSLNPEIVALGLDTEKHSAFPCTMLNLQKEKNSQPIPTIHEHSVEICVSVVIIKGEKTTSLKKKKKLPDAQIISSLQRCYGSPPVL